MAIQVIPQELVAAVRPLQDAGRALRDLGDARREVLALTDTVPDAELHAAVASYIKQWSYVALDLGDQAIELASALAYAARWYADREQALARGFSFSRRLP